jgi:hypothetical protein
MTKLSTLFFIFFLLGARGYGQIAASDSAFLARAQQNAMKIYVAAIGDQANLYNGVQYLDYVTSADTEGHPYFKSDDFADGSVYYDSGLYSNIPMMYDLIKDKLVLDQPFSHFKMELISEKVKSFDLSGHHFERLARAKNDSSISTGFYDLLYNGNVKVYAKRHKERKETALSTGIKVEYLDKDQLFIYKDGQYFHVKSKPSVLAVFRDKKKILRKEINANKNRINFNTDRDGAIAMLAKLYDETEKR